ncbi:fungal-specific transcription factor domain-containing protein [Aspergillus ambiguus]|uniref:Zn(II)2Cys6 transcription factor n=1 Tax=Aspergillus ambiguus TaxID=176160 RepID=UPI003CCE1B07
MSSKPRGCFQCSKRRIICDGAEPVCKKCQKKSLECSGLGRFRFSNGLARRGKLKGCVVPVPHLSPAEAFPPEPANSARFPPQKLQWKNEQGCRTRQKQKRNGKATVDPQEGSVGQMEGSGDRASVPSAVGQWIPPLNSRTRMLFSYFATEVAPVMVILDKISNGYRELLLPMACEDRVLERAISAVASQHIAGRCPTMRVEAESERAAVISCLRQDSLQSSADRVFNVSTWATLIVLLVGETITGSSEYRYLLHTLTCLAENISQVEYTAANSFLTQQTHMFQLLGTPLLGERKGIHALQRPIEQYMDWTQYDLPPDSEHHRVLALSRLAFMNASKIYLGRTMGNNNQWESLESLKQVVSQIDPEEPGSHALVWVCFIAAADSTDPEHRAFFIDRMNKVYAKTQFRNISAAIESLPGIWSAQGSSRWTREVIPTLVM